MDVVRRTTQSQAGNDEDRRFVQAFPRRKALPDGVAREAASARLVKLRGFPAGTFEPLLPAIGEHIQIVQVAEGDAVFSHKDPERSLLLILSGSASARTIKGRVLGRFTAGASAFEESMLGELGFLADVPRDGTVFADSTATFLEISTDALPWLAQAHPDITFKLHVALLRTVCGRILEADGERKLKLAINAGHFDSWIDE
jgi:CRP-like cAMP-binding protein